MTVLIFGLQSEEHAFGNLSDQLFGCSLETYIAQNNPDFIFYTFIMKATFSSFFSFNIYACQRNSKIPNKFK